MEAALFADERRFEAEVHFLEPVAHLAQQRHGVLGLLQAAAHQGRIRRPVRVVHDMIEGVVHNQRRAALLVLQHLGSHSERAGNLDAVDGRNGRALLNGHDLEALLRRLNRGHEARGAAADDRHIRVIHLVSARNLGHGLAQEGLAIAARLRHAVRHGVDHRAGGLGRARDDVHAARLILENGRDQLIVHGAEQHRRFAVLHNLDRGDRSLGEGGLHSDVGDVAVAGGGVGAGLVSGALSQHTHGRNSQTQARSAHALQEIAAGNVLAHRNSSSFDYADVLRA